MRRAWIAAPTFLIVGFAVPTSPAWAESPGAAASATAHALAEQANSCAQHRPECWTPTPRATPVPAATSTATLVVPTATPTVEPSPTPEPVLPAPARGADPLAGYLRPSPYGADIAGGVWQELALPTGRWDVAMSCMWAADRGDWADVLLFTGPGLSGDVPTIGDRDYFGDGTWGSCAVNQWFWHSATPCAQDTETGLCSAEADPVLQELEASTVAQVLPAGGPPDDGLSADQPVPAVLAPPPADPRNPGAAPQQPIVIMIVTTPAPIPPLAPPSDYQSAAPVDPPPPVPATVIYVVVTPTPLPQPTVDPTIAPTPVPTDEPAQMRAPVVAAALPPPPEPRAPVNQDHMPLPMLASFGLLWTRRRVREQTAPWMIPAMLDDDGEETLCLPAPSR